MNPDLLGNLKFYQYKFVSHPGNRENTCTILIANNEE
jgi:hypothetical protein